MTLDLGSRENADESSLRAAFARMLTANGAGAGGQVDGMSVSAAGDNWWRVIVGAGENRRGKLKKGVKTGYVCFIYNRGSQPKIPQAT